MSSPLTSAQVAAFAERGWLAIERAASPDTLARLQACCDAVLADPERLGFDPAAAARAAAQGGAAASDLPGPVIHSTAEAAWLEWREDPLHRWAHEAAAALLGAPVDYWFNQLLLKPPRVGGASFWHQDDGYLGAGDAPFLVSCWLALDPVDLESGCLRFVDGGHRQGIVRALLPTPAGSPRLEWRPDPARVVDCPLPAGGAVFHHGKAPHDAPPNRSPRWRRAFVQRFTLAGAPRPAAHTFDADA